MWCTRWFLPLLLLPLPTAPPYFLLLFLFSLTLHARPCFYCIILLTTLFVSSCYWQPFPLDSPLSVPWADNITTFSEALNSTMSSNYPKPLPSVMRAADRCWCDFSSGSLFEPFNMSRWEHVSVQKVKEDLETSRKMEEARALDAAREIVNDTAEATPTSGHSATPLPTDTPTSRSAWAILRASDSSTNESSVRTGSDQPPPIESFPSPHQSPAPKTTRPPYIDANLPLLRKEYDLRAFGMDMVIDFRWSRET